MAILDNNTEIADATALSTAATGRQLVGDVIDLVGLMAVVPNAPSAKGTGAGVFFNASIDTTFASGGAATVTFELVSDAQSAIATDGSATVHAATGAFPVASLVAGVVVLSIEVPPRPAAERYLGLIANVGTAGLTAGKVNCWLGDQPATGSRIYGDNVA